MPTRAQHEPHDKEQSVLQAQLLGELCVRYQARVIPEAAFRRRRALTLLLALLLAPGRQLPREVVLERLWPEGDPGAGADNLNSVVSALRAALGGGPNATAIQSRAGTIALAPDLHVDLDVADFEAAATAALETVDRTALLRAAALYRGPLLPSLPYEDWVERRREPLARLNRRVLTALAAAEAASDPDAAEERLHALLATEPTNEPAARRLMRLLGARGQRAEALRVYGRLRQALRDELDLTPGQKTQALYAAVRVQQQDASEEEIYQVSHPQLLPASPPLRSPEAPMHNLPRQTDTFIGRERAQVEVAELLGRAALVTLTGAGGVGKTRLALAVAEGVAAAYPDGVWLVELAPLADPALLPGAVARAVGLGEAPGRDLVATLADYLRERRVLLLLDNCEHLVEACAGLVSALLRAGAHLQILATSREGLAVAGEVRYRVPSLSVPDAHAPPPLDLVPAYESVRLFVARAQALRQDFGMNQQNAAAVAAICVRLDGIPLAIELAAARVGVLSVEGIVARLDDRFRLLTGGRRDALPRQQTLQAALDWSWALLDEPERSLLRRLSVFANGWTLAAAEAVCQAADLPAGVVLDVLAALAAKSLVQVVEHLGQSRYGLLETVQQYARSQLIAAREEEEWRDRHLHWCLALAVEAAPGLMGPEQGTWLARLDREHDNMRAALAWAREREMGEDALRLAGSLWRFWAVHGFHAEGRRWLEEALANAGTVSAAARAVALNGAGNLAWQQGDYARANVLHEEALALRRSLGDTPGIAGSLGNLGTVAYRQGDYRRAATLYEEALTRYRQLADRWGIAGSLNNLAMVAYQRGEYAQAATLYEDGLALQRALQDQKGVAGSLSNLGLVVSRQGDHGRAAALQEEALAMQRALGDKWGAALTLGHLGAVLSRQGDAARAVALHQESLALLRDIGDAHSIALSLGNVGEIAAMEGDYTRAAMLFEEGLALQRPLGDRHGSARSLTSLGMVAYMQGDPARAASLYREGLVLSQEMDARDQQAEGLEGLAWLAAAGGRTQRATRLGGAAQALREALDVPLQPGQQAGHEQAVQTLRTALGDAAFATAWAEGKAMPLEQVIADALR